MLRPQSWCRHGTFDDMVNIQGGPFAESDWGGRRGRNSEQSWAKAIEYQDLRSLSVELIEVVMVWTVPDPFYVLKTPLLQLLCREEQEASINGGKAVTRFCGKPWMPGLAPVQP